jgi:hypothetical protein
MADGPMGHLVDGDREAVLDAQPFIGFSLNPECDLQAFVEVKSRTRASEIASARYTEEPVSIYLTVRRYGPLSSIDEFASVFAGIAEHVERLAEERVVPQVVMPIREAILSRPN